MKEVLKEIKVGDWKIRFQVDYHFESDYNCWEGYWEVIAVSPEGEEICLASQYSEWCEAFIKHPRRVPKRVRSAGHGLVSRVHPKRIEHIRESEL